MRNPTPFLPRTHPSDPGEPQHGIPRIGVDPEEEHVLRLLASGARVLEIGTGLGYSTRAFIRGGARSIDTVDIDPWVLSAILPDLQTEAARANIPLTFHSDLHNIGTGYDLIFVDADHSYACVRRDAIAALSAGRFGSLVLFHDWCHAEDSVLRAVLGVVDNAVRPFFLPTRYGIGIISVTEKVSARAGLCREADRALSIHGDSESGLGLGLP